MRGLAVRNVHQRELPCPGEEVGALVDSLSSPGDRLWPWESWPAQRFDRPLGIEARGGHGPIRYWVEAYEPGRRVRYRFTAPKGFEGWHEFSVGPAPSGSRLVHTVSMRPTVRGWLVWVLAIGPLHDALIEDSLAKAARELGVAAGPPPRWSWRVRLLRRALGGTRRRGARRARRKRAAVVS